MPRIVIACWSFPGHLRPSLVLAKALRERGHDVAFSTGPRGRELVEKSGFRCFPYTYLDEGALYEKMFSSEQASASVRHPVRFLSVLRYWVLETIPEQMAELTEVLGRWPADVLVADVTLWAPFLILSDLGTVPVVVLSFAPGCMIPHKDVPPWGMGIEAPRGGLVRKLGYRCLVAFHRMSAEFFRRGANRHRKAYGLPPLAVPVNAYAGRMPLYLVPSARELDDPRADLPESVHYVGPLIEKDSEQGGSLPQWFPTLRTAYPKIHVTEGTVSYQEPLLLKAAVEGFAGEPFEVIITTGRQMKVDFLSPARLPPNIHVETFIPHELLMPHIDCLVSTAGAGTVLTALRHGVPMVLAPTEWDKPDNARHVKKVGAGMVVPYRHCKGGDLRKAVGEVLADPRFRESARRMQGVLAGYRGAQEAAELIENLCCARSTMSSVCRP